MSGEVSRPGGFVERHYLLANGFLLDFASREPLRKGWLDRRLFRGPFDERYGEIEGTGRWGRVYVGRGVAE